MASTNKKTKPDVVYTHEGARTTTDSVTSQLRRAVLACMLWEDNFYESGEEIAKRIWLLAQKVSLPELSSLAKEARHTMHLRHVPLMLCVAMARRGTKIVSDTIESVVARADELSELVSLYWKMNPVDKGKKGNARGKAPLSKQILLGLKKAFPKFNEYALAKYNQDKDVTLRDVLFLAHPTPESQTQARIWKRLANKELKTPDTWEVAISACTTTAEKKAEMTRLLKEGKLGYFALIRNLRNMTDWGVGERLVRDTIIARQGGADKVLPSRFIAAATAAPKYADALDDAFLANLREAPKLPGKTVAIIDVSGSMYGGAVSAKSDMTRAHAACALGAILREVCEIPRVYATAGSDTARRHKTEIVPAFRGLALAKNIYEMTRPLGGGGIFLKQVMDYVSEHEKNVDRVIVITDEQDCGTASGDAPGNAKIIGDTNYIINVASHQNGIAFNKWTHINGFSEACVNYIRESEQLLQLATSRN